jgi:hypothetical protein
MEMCNVSYVFNGSIVYYAFRACSKYLFIEPRVLVPVVFVRVVFVFVFVFVAANFVIPVDIFQSVRQGHVRAIRYGLVN